VIQPAFVHKQTKISLFQLSFAFVFRNVQIDSEHQRQQASLGQLLELGIRIAQLHTLAS